MASMETLVGVLGIRVQDMATGLIGVVTSVSFDLSGCLQVLIAPPAKEDGTLPERAWFDIGRVQMLNRVVDAPGFSAYTLPKEKREDGVRGTEPKPVSSKPVI